MDVRVFAGLLLVSSCGFDASGVDSSNGEGGPGSATVDDGTDDGMGTEPGPGPQPTTATATTSPPDPTTTAGPSSTDATASGDTSDADSGDESSSSSTGDASSSGEPPLDDTCNGVPMPEIANTLGPVQEISVHDVAFVDTGTNIIRAAPGAEVSIGFQYEVASCECTGCITQGMLGIPDDEWRACFYDGLPGCDVDSGAAELEIIAPLAPGFYPLSFWRTWQYDCEPDVGEPPDDTVVAGICVEEA